MPDKSIPQKNLGELIARNQVRLESRVDNIIEIEKQLGKKGKRISKLATWSKIFIIILGAIIATRVVADRLWSVEKNDQETSRKEIEIVFTILSVGIAIIGGLDSAFKPGEIATEINFMKVRCKTAILEIEERWAKEIEVLGVSKKALNHSLTLLTSIDNCLNETLTRLAQLKIHLRTEKPTQENRNLEKT